MMRGVLSDFTGDACSRGRRIRSGRGGGYVRGGPGDTPCAGLRVISAEPLKFRKADLQALSIRIVR
jgi:hypothetical protein